MLIYMSDFWAKHDSRNFKATILVIALTKTWIVFSIFWKLIAINFLCCMYSVWKHLCDILCYVSTCKCSWLYVVNENYDGAFWCFDNSVEEIKFM